MNCRQMLGILVPLALAAAGLPACAAEPEAVRVPGTIRVVMPRNIFRDLPDATFTLMARPFNRLVQTQIGLPGELTLATDATALAQQLTTGAAHLGVFN